jgi:hypothetical protein
MPRDSRKELRKQLRADELVKRAEARTKIDTLRADALAKRGRLRTEAKEKLKRQKDILKYDDIELEKEIKHTYYDKLDNITENLKNKKVTSEQAIKKAQELKGNIDKRLTSYKETKVKKFRGGRLGIDNAGQKLVQKLYSKGGKV